MKYLYTVILLTLAASVSGQNLLSSRRSGFYTYIYKVTNEEARRIYNTRNEKWISDYRFFHMPVDSFPLYTEYGKNLSPGHYLKVSVKNNTVEASFMSVLNVNAQIVTNYTDLCVQLYDTAGILISNASVKLKGKTLRYNNQVKGYVLLNSNRRGLLEVRYKGITSYFDLQRNQNSSPIRRFENVVLIGTPLRYIWVPVKFIFAAPVITVRDFVYGNPYRIWNELSGFWRRNGIIRESRNYHDSKKGYFVFSKPRYLPHDTVRYKAFLVNSSGRPVKKTLDLELANGMGSHKNLGKIRPVRPGNFNGEFVLSDTLNLDLDAEHMLMLKRGYRTFGSGGFRFEDYELKNISLTVRSDSDTQIRGRRFRIYIRATDENDLNIQDGRIELSLESKDISTQYVPHLFIKDTLFVKKIALEPSGETQITISDSLFPAADLSYLLKVKVLRTDNEYKEFSKSINFYDHPKEIQFELLQDSILFTFKENGRVSAKAAKITGIDKFGFKRAPESVILPWKDKIDPYINSYLVSTKEQTKNIHIDDQLSRVGCESAVIHDSLRVKIVNPRGLPVTWFLYRANRLETKGHGTEFAFTDKMRRNSRYFMMLVYLWSGTTRNEIFDLSGKKNELNLKVEQPPLVFPGQKVNMSITVTDFYGKPVEGADLTAFSYTKKFSNNPEGVYEFSDRRKTKNATHSFRINQKIVQEKYSVPLDYDHWKKTFVLDTVEFYKFLYHKNDIYSYSFRPQERSTQFAPFIIKNGQIQSIDVINVDRVPVYFGWVSHINQPYSFRVDSGYHYVEIRTRFKRYLIDSVYFKYGMKSIMGINDKDLPKDYKWWKAKPYLSDNEKLNYSRYLFPYRNNFENKFAWLNQGGKITLLNTPPVQYYPSGSYYNAGNYNYNQYGDWYGTSKITGPVKPDMTWLKTAGGYDHSFLNEQGFEYEFFPSVIKMRSIDKDKLFSPLYLNGNADLSFSDTPLTEKRILDSYDDFVFNSKISSAKFNLPKETLPSNGMLSVSIDSLSKGSGPVPVFLILMSQTDPLKAVVYPVSIKEMKNVEPGLWSVILFYRGERYFRYDSIPVRGGGRNFSHLTRPGSPKHDNLSGDLNEIVEEQLYRTNTKPSAEFQDYLRQLQRQQSLVKYSGEGMLVSGTVTGAGEGPLPGVTVSVKGTTIGTATDMNGNYSLVVPFDKKELVFSYIGYKNIERQIVSEFTDVTMESEVMALNEVVVTAYGIARHRDLTGRVSGVTVSGAPGATGAVRIRGISSLNTSNSPLFVIDGIPYSGDLSDLDPEMITNMTVLKDENLASIYGARAANGVVVINTSGMNIKSPKLKAMLKGAMYDSTFMQEVNKASSVRTNFNDNAYWKPDLVTDKDGRVSFEVKFPDDVTSWSTYVMAMNGEKQSGMTNGSIKSYKPLMAQLFTPRFLIEGDSSNLIGKVLNYTPDTVSVVVKTVINDLPAGTKKADCKNSITDTLPLFAGSEDTLKVRYFFERKDGYLDGEERKIPVFKKGLEMTAGKFFILNGDTSVNLSNNPQMGDGRIYLQADRLDVVKYEIYDLSLYSYECNEQLASKLLALIAQETVCKFEDKLFIRKMLVNRIIRALEKNQNSDGCWGWWDRSETSPWITIHVVRALTEAKKMGYNVRMNTNSLHDYVIWKLESKISALERLDLLYLISFTEDKVNYRDYIARIDENSLINLQDKFRLTELKQRLGMEYSIDSVIKYENHTMFGNVYFGKESIKPMVCYNEVQTTLTAYRVIKQSKQKNDDYLEKIRNFFFERRRIGRWQNTYETASIIENILPDLLKGTKGEPVKPIIILSGSVNRTVTDFPLEIKTKATDSLNVRKTGTFPVYFTSYQHYWKKDPSTDTTYFGITTSLEGRSDTMISGKPIKMKVILRVHNDAQYTMMEIPVPGGCSYDTKNGYFEASSHTEFFKDHVAVFFDSLRPGKYEYEIKLLPRYTGRYTVNPARAGLMYFPVFSSNNSLKTLMIK